MDERKMHLEVGEKSEEALEDEDPYVADEKIQQSFENLKEIVNWSFLRSLIDKFHHPGAL